MSTSINSGSNDSAAAAELTALRAEIAELRSEVARLGASLAAVAAVDSDTPNLIAGVQPDTAPETSHGAWTRRGLLLGGVGAAIGATSALAGASPAAAVSGAMQYGGMQNAGASTTVLTSTAAGQTLHVINTSTAPALRAQSNLLVGVEGLSNSGFGVRGTSIQSAGTFGQSATGAGLVGRSNSGAALDVSSDSGPTMLLVGKRAAVPSAGAWQRGALVMTTGGELWCCVTGGSPGVWRRVVGPTTAGSFVPLAVPTVVYDSRAAQPTPGRLKGGANRVVSVANGRNASGAVTLPNVVPAGATAIVANITLDNTAGKGFLAVTPGNANGFSSSSINWSASNQIVANGITVGIDSARQIKVFSGGSPEGTNFLIGVMGYYR